jgi:hypothetical protein
MQIRGKRILIYPRDCGGSGGGGRGGSISCNNLQTFTEKCNTEELDVEEIEVTLLYISSKMADQIVKLVEHQTHRMNKLVLRSCQSHPKVLEKLLSLSTSSRKRIKHLEIHKTSTLNQNCMEAICRLQNLESLTLNINQGLEYLFPFLIKLKSLKTLNLNGCQMERNGRMIDTFAEYLQRISTSKNCQLTDISLKCCRLSDQSIHKVVLSMIQLTSLEKLDIVGNSCCNQGLHGLGRLLSSSHLLKLRVLDVSYQLGDFSEITQFATALQSNTSLIVLRMAGNSLGNDNVCLLAKSLAINNTLENLDLSANSVGDIGLQALIQAMEQNQVLTTLSLKYNVFADLSCLESVLRLHNFSLQQLNHTCKQQHSRSVRDGNNGERISYYLRLNQGGRILLKRDETPLGLWPVVFERNTPSGNFDAIFFMLRNSPMLYRAAT